jgi:hypothetical protein
MARVYGEGLRIEESGFNEAGLNRERYDMVEDKWNDSNSGGLMKTISLTDEMRSLQSHCMCV